MKPAFRKYDNAELNEVIQRLVMLLANVSLDNFKYTFVEGTTDSVANTAKTFSHGFKDLPSLALIVEGNAYVAKNGLGYETVDVRSADTSQEFKALIIR